SAAGRVDPVLRCKSVVELQAASGEVTGCPRNRGEIRAACSDGQSWAGDEDVRGTAVLSVGIIIRIANDHRRPVRSYGLAEVAILPALGILQRRDRCRVRRAACEIINVGTLGDVRS